MNQETIQLQTTQEKKSFVQDTLKPLRSKIRQHEFISFDIETTSDNSDFYICGIKNKDEQITFFRKEDAIKYLLNPHIKGIRVANNLSFDFNILFYQDKRFLNFKKIMKGSDYVYCSYKIGHKTIKFLDAWSFGSFSVETEGEILKIPKKKQPSNVDHLKLQMINGQNIEIPVWRKPKTLDELESLLDYNQNDCLITEKYMQLIQQGINELGGELKATIASSSMNIYQHAFMLRTMRKEEAIYPGINKLIYDAYYGGRVEAFKRGLFLDVKIFDANGLFSWSQLQEFPDPNSCVYLEKGGDIQLIMKYPGISTVTIKCPKMDKPFLPIHGVKLIFGFGIWRASYTHLELKYAVENLGYEILKIHHTLYYTKTFYPFKEYIEKIYSKRLEYQLENNPLESCMKLCANSLYGKWAQHNLSDVEFIEKRNDTAYPEDCTIGDKYVYKTTSKICNYAHVFPIFSVYVTAYARIKMFPFLCDKETIYSDTDSLITTKDYPVSKVLGDFKLECKCKKVLIVRAKFYKKILEDDKVIIKAKGFTRIKEENFTDLLLGKDFYFRKPSKLKTSIRKKINPNTWQLLHKKINLEDDKRKWEKPFNQYESQDSNAWCITDNKINEDEILSCVVSR